MLLVDDLLAPFLDAIVGDAHLVVGCIAVGLLIHAPLVVPLLPIFLKVLRVHLDQALRVHSLANLFLLDVVVIFLQSGLQELFAFHLLDILELLLPVLFIGEVINTLGLLLHALQQLFVFHVSFVSAGLSDQVLHFLLLHGFLTLLLLHVRRLDYDLLV
mmetsp:Transcript_2921/g.3918  ORF Transcript_2921/g.3918 Transcript_2921/m.3918 type:complete len:159 (-) Transcript_2921:250-726(-)